VHAESPSTAEAPAEPRAGTVRAVVDRWNRFWFHPVAPADLALSRLVFFGFLFAYYLPVSPVGWGSVPASWRDPIWIFERLHLPILSDRALAVLGPLWKLSLLLSCFGLATRVSTAVAFALGAYLIALPYNFGKTDHMTALVLWTLGILALSRCGDAWSVDALIRRRLGRPPPSPSGEYRWSVRAVWLTMCVVFFAAGMAKLMRGGLAWVFSEHMAISLVQQHYSLDPPDVTWGLFIARHAWMAQLMAGASLLLELAAPLALFSRRARWVLPALLLAMQLGIAVLMNVWFTRFMFVYVFWVPWGRLLPRRLQSD
jgi:hypothetical protein